MGINGFLWISGMIVSIGIANLQFVDLNSARNLFVIGFSFFFGLILPQWLKNNQDAINTGLKHFLMHFEVLTTTLIFASSFKGPNYFSRQ